MRSSVLAGLFLGLLTFTASCQSATENEPTERVEIMQKDKKLINSAEFADVINSEDVQLIDVRTADEYSSGHISEARNVDFMQTDQFESDVNGLDKNRPVAIYCASGKRSQGAASYLIRQGYSVYELSGGYQAWMAHSK